MLFNFLFFCLIQKFKQAHISDTPFDNKSSTTKTFTYITVFILLLQLHCCGDYTIFMGSLFSKKTSASSPPPQFVILDPLLNTHTLSSDGESCINDCNNIVENGNASNNNSDTNTDNSEYPRLSHYDRARLHTRVQGYFFRHVKYNLAFFYVDDYGVFCLVCREMRRTGHSLYVTRGARGWRKQDLCEHCDSAFHLRNCDAYFEKYPNTPTHKRNYLSVIASALLSTLSGQKKPITCVMSRM